jgi:glycosyltransferase involved in cell wall biosynthesis
MNLTVCMIVRDEEELLPQALRSLEYTEVEGDVEYGRRKVWDQLVVLDTGSVDKTKEIARAFGAEVYDFEWCDNFAAARNAAECYAKGEYILWIDGDETLIAGHPLIRDIVEDGEIDAVMPSIRGAMGDLDVPVIRNPMLRRKRLGVWEHAVHEEITGVEAMAEPRIVYQHHTRTTQRNPALDDHTSILEAEINKKPSCRLLGHQAREYASSGHAAAAIALIEQALQFEDGHELERSELAIIQGNLYSQRDEYWKALRSYLRALEEWDGWAEPYYFLAYLQAKQGKFDRAIPWLFATSVIQPIEGHMPFGESIYEWRISALAGQCYANLGRFEEALPLLQDAYTKSQNEELRQQLMACRARAMRTAETMTI